MALKPTDGLVRGAPVVNTGSPIMVPVGEGVLGHVYNVLGEPLDTDASNVHPADHWPIHREAPYADAPAVGCNASTRRRTLIARNGIESRCHARYRIRDAPNNATNPIAAYRACRSKK